MSELAGGKAQHSDWFTGIVITYSDRGVCDCPLARRGLRHPRRSTSKVGPLGPQQVVLCLVDRRLHGPVCPATNGTMEMGWVQHGTDPTHDDSEKRSPTQCDGQGIVRRQPWYV